jgi:hypothetical protein
MTCSNSVRRSPTATMTTGNVCTSLASPGQEGRRLKSAGAAAYPVSLRARAGRLVLGHVELAAAVEPLLLPKDVGGHRLAPAGL